jgi:hypothetical protein
LKSRKRIGHFIFHNWQIRRKTTTQSPNNIEFVVYGIGMSSKGRRLAITDSVKLHLAPKHGSR